MTTFNEFGFMFANGSASPVTLTVSGFSLVPPNPVIASQPVGYSGSPGDNTPGTDFAVTLTAASAASGYQWYQVTNSISGLVTNGVSNGATGDGSTISGATTASLSFANAQLADSANYFVVATNAYGAVTSSLALLNIANSSSPPNISSLSPSNTTVVAGNSLTETITATGVPAPFYYWFDNNNNLLQNSANATLTVPNLQYSQLGTYSVIASNSVGTATNYFTVNVVVTPTISSQPTNLLLNLGDPATFLGHGQRNMVPTLTYQWWHGQHGPSLLRQQFHLLLRQRSPDQHWCVQCGGVECCRLGDQFQCSAGHQLHHRRHAVFPGEQRLGHLLRYAALPCVRPAGAGWQHGQSPHF